ncbi:hypothetical protein [Botrimarina mediterranea]|uniref:hypothetical protein n=1 Tax=Botrimarina mediterranea TaxID=2528022 RepID=UPI00118C6248|nr:hypothetical protein K2D_08890 [Planctomycetes bacterium K2D]
MALRIFWMTTSVVFTVTIASLVWALSDEMGPVFDGEPNEFWESLCRADFNNDGERHLADAYHVDERWCAYTVQRIHDRLIFRVPYDDVESLLSDVVQRIETNTPEDLKAYVLVGHARWRDSKEAKTLPRLIREINDAQRRLTYRRDVDSLAYNVANEYWFWLSWRASKWYWATLLFDWAFLSVWVSFVLWPGIVGARYWRWCVHLAIAPPLFAIPVYLGYAASSFTNYGPEGGVLYPFLVQVFRGSPMNAFDSWLFERLPPLLEVISTPILEGYSPSELGIPGITGIAISGAVLGFALWSGPHFFKWLIVGYFPGCFANDSRIT